MLAAATGSGSTSSKTPSKSRPSSDSTIRNAISFENVGTSSWSFCSSSRYSPGSRSGRLARACPALMMAGPRPAMTSRSSPARVLRFVLSVPRTMSDTTPAAHIPNGRAMRTFLTSHLPGCRKSIASDLAGSYATVGAATSLAAAVVDMLPDAVVDESPFASPFFGLEEADDGFTDASVGGADTRAPSASIHRPPGRRLLESTGLSTESNVSAIRSSVVASSSRTSAVFAPVFRPLAFPSPSRSSSSRLPLPPNLSE
mmetsp:Transcript_22275/g.51063  ORF Transcript_22275/g.51063 Transcript_22275/m.51063 type:complete len:257 (+) Transcript_22275:309-1079(+)